MGDINSHLSSSRGSLDWESDKGCHRGAWALGHNNMAKASCCLISSQSPNKAHEMDLVFL